MPDVLFSAELRWFFKGEPPAAVPSWFHDGPFPPGGGRVRRDEYLRDLRQRELGIKKRGRNPGVEIKGLVDERVRRRPPFDGGRVQLWTKWVSPSLSIDHLPQIVVEKTRWLRKFSTDGTAVRELRLGADEQLEDPAEKRPDQGCGLELVSLSTNANDRKWWALAFEAFGPPASLEMSLERTIASLPPLDPTVLAGALELSYPGWLATEVAHEAR